MKTAPHPSGFTIGFDEGPHVYFVVDHEKDYSFVSGTTFISRFFPKFDTETISARYAKKHSLSQQEVKDMWARKGLIARTNGTLTHDYAEKVVLGLNPAKMDPQENLKVNRMQHTVDKALAYLSKSYEFLEPEMIIASLGLGYAGMLDLPAVHKKTGRKVIFDYKTNAAIKTENIWQSGLKPIRHLQDTNFNHYCLQLNFYEYLGKYDGYFDKDEPIDKTLVHIREDDFDLYPCFDMQKEIDSMLSI